jgi:hypothetical protein
LINGSVGGIRSEQEGKKEEETGRWRWKSGGGSVWIAGPVVKIRDRGLGGSSLGGGPERENWPEELDRRGSKAAVTEVAAASSQQQ